MAFIGHVLGIMPPCAVLFVFFLRLMKLSCVYSLSEDALGAAKKNPEEQEGLTGCQGLQGTRTKSQQKGIGE